MLAVEASSTRVSENIAPAFSGRVKPNIARITITQCHLLLRIVTLTRYVGGGQPQACLLECISGPAQQNTNRGLSTAEIFVCLIMVGP